ncbi:MAG: hypothetical protein M3Q92_15275 [Actinomycetota bacterium]|nr:hypothetical protein [Actinomycetota bacterium]
MSPFWRRDEPLHEKLAREGGLVEPPPHDPSPRWGEVGIHGVHRQRVWDAVATVEVPDLEGETAAFVALPDGSLLAETDDLDIEPLAGALEAMIQPPYRAEAVRRADGLWAVAARRIDVIDVPEPIDGDQVVVTNRHGERTIEVDGARVFGSLPTFEQLLASDAVLTAHRLDELLWQVEVVPL